MADLALDIKETTSVCLSSASSSVPNPRPSSRSLQRNRNQIHQNVTCLSDHASPDRQVCVCVCPRQPNLHLESHRARSVFVCSHLKHLISVWMPIRTWLPQQRVGGCWISEATINLQHRSLPPKRLHDWICTSIHLSIALPLPLNPIWRHSRAES